MFKLIAIILFWGVTLPAFGQVPEYLKNYWEAYNENPRAANLQWFKDARF